MYYGIRDPNIYTHTPNTHSVFLFLTLRRRHSPIDLYGFISARERKRTLVDVTIVILVVFQMHYCQYFKYLEVHQTESRDAAKHNTKNIYSINRVNGFSPKKYLKFRTNCFAEKKKKKNSHSSSNNWEKLNA